MFQRPAAIGGDTRLSSVPRSVYLPKGNNENSIPTSKVTTTPTNSLQRPRRAFGDISNRKKPTDVGGDKGGNKGNSHRNSNSIVLKPRASAVNPPKNASVTPQNSTQQFPSRIPTIGGSKTSQKQELSKRVHPWSTQVKRSSSSLPSPAIPTGSRQVEFIIPTSTTQKGRNETQDAVQSNKASKVTEAVPDVELPAGRLWVEQEQHVFDDEASTSSLPDLLESRTMWDDYNETMKEQWDKERKELAEADEAFLQSRFDELLREDELGKPSVMNRRNDAVAVMFHPISLLLLTCRDRFTF